jgi:benzoyl-CoA reductase/2-hydroxyglutaryl-CoA dehydratase subunit BcrC/BadD/HgdB
VEALRQIQQYYRHRDLAAREWRAQGGKVVGYLCDIVPTEMIMAAGFFPLRISGDPHSGTELADKYTEPSYEPDARSILHLILSGKYDFLDYLIIPHSRDAVYKLYHHLRRIEKIEVNLNLPQIFFLDMTHTRFWLSTKYAHDRFLELRKILEKWSGKKISKRALSKAIKTSNENRCLLERVRKIRTAQPPRLSGTQALQIIGGSMFMLKEKHNILLSQLLEEANQLPERPGKRLFILGSPLDNLQLYELAESCNATVVDEDNCWGNRNFECPLNEDIDPMEAIFDRYYANSLCPQMYPMTPRLEYALRSALNSGAEGAVFYYLEWDNASMWEYPEQKNLLEGNGIKTLCLNMQKYVLASSDKKKLKNSLEQFILDLKQKV